MNAPANRIDELEPPPVVQRVVDLLGTIAERSRGDHAVVDETAKAIHSLRERVDASDARARAQERQLRLLAALLEVLSDAFTRLLAQHARAATRARRRRFVADLERLCALLNAPPSTPAGEPNVEGAAG